jgi:hypothetical protein
MELIKYARLKLYLQTSKTQAAWVGGSASGGDLNLLPSFRSESLKLRPDPFQLSLGFLEGSRGRGVSLITCYDAFYSRIRDGSNTCRARDISNGLPSIVRHRHLSKY